MPRFLFVFLPLAAGCALVSGLSNVTLCSTDPCPMQDAGADVDLDASTCAMDCSPFSADWTLVTPAENGACRPGLAQQSFVLASVVPSSDACPCTCQQTMSPTCVLPASVPGGYGDKCSTSMFFKTSGCELIAFGKGLPSNTSYAAGAGQAQSGACAPSTTPAASAITKTPSVLCAAPAGCRGLLCGGGAKVCGLHTGDVACPAAYANKTLLATDIGVTCSCSATCAVQTRSCNAVVHLYQDTNCAQEITGTGLPFPADGACHAVASANQTLV